MGNGTCTSKAEVKAMLNDVAPTVKKHYGVSLRFVEILGERWSFIAGTENDDSSFLPPEHIAINAHQGIVSDRWHEIPAGERDTITVRARRIAESYEQG
jgi:hypothetical protein